jgi:uncharacterized protein (DUF362 family)
MNSRYSRRDFLATVGMAAGAYMARPALLSARPLSATRVAIGQCPEYNQQVIDTLSNMFDQLGGLKQLVRGKTVSIKLNMTGGPNTRLNGLPVEMTNWVHPQVVGATVHLLGQAGARRIRLLESSSGVAPLEEAMIAAGWKPQDFVSAAPKVEFENTNFLGSGKTYARFMVPGGGLMYAGYDLNHSYMDTDVFVSLAKLKQHRANGITLSMKNCFGITPCTIYGDRVPEDEPGLVPTGGRFPFHSGNRLPPKSAPPLVGTDVPKDQTYRVPRVVADLVAARPVHLAVIDGIYSMSGGELPNQGPHAIHKPVHPGMLIAGTNCVSTDAVGIAAMGFDPMADRGTPPFDFCDSSLKFAEQLGVGTRDLSRIDVVGTPIAKVMYKYSTMTEQTV